MDAAWYQTVGRREEWERENANAIAMADALMAIFGLVRKEIKDCEEGKDYGNEPVCKTRQH